MKSFVQSHLALAGMIVCLALLTTNAAHADEFTFNINATGAQEVSAGDPDGFAIGTITFNNGTGAGTTGSATISLTMTNIDLTNLTGHHIHQANVGVNGGIVLDFGDPDNIRIGDTLSGMITGLSATTITGIFANPTNFYYNLHNSAFPGGAVRDQLSAPIPEPHTTAFLALGGLALLVGWQRHRKL